MKIRTSDIYRTEYAKYQYASKLISGKVLDITYGKYLDYTKSKLLLENNCNEVWSLDILDINQYVTLRKLNNDKITVEIKSKKELDSINFDSILGFNIISVTDNIDETLKFIKNHLKHNGIGILSITNDDGCDDNHHDLLSKDLNLFSNTDFQIILKKYFNNVMLISQGNITHQKLSATKVKINLKLKLRNYFLHSIKSLNFYLKYVRPIQNFLTTSKQTFKNEKTQKYDIVHIDDDKKMLFTIAVCKNI